MQDLLIQLGDISDSKQQALLQALIDSLPDLIFYKDKQNIYLGCNKAFELFAGVSREDIIGKTDQDLFPQQVAEFFREKDGLVFASGEARRNEEWVDYPDGSKVLLDTLKTPYFSANGDLLGLVGASRDITDLQKSHEQLAHSLSLQQATLESTTDGILVVDNNGKWQSYNQKFLDMWRLPPSITQSKNDAAAIQHVLEQLQFPDEFVHKVKKLYATPEATSFDEVQFIDGRIFERFSIPQVLDEKIIGRVWSFRDVTTRKRTEAFVERNAEILEMIAKGEDVSNIYDAIVLMYEDRHPGMRCSLLELKGNKLMHGGAPSLPKEYCDAINGLEHGPSAGSCGASTYSGKRVLVEDIAIDPKWAAIKHVALPHGMRCCWSEPVKNSQGEVLGAFGMYYNYPALPDENELEDLVSAARLASIIMERDHREIELRQSEYKYRTLVENLPQRFFLKDKKSTFVFCSNNFAGDLDITPQQIVGTTDYDYFTEKLAKKYQQEDQRVIQSGSTEEFIETIIIDDARHVSRTIKTPVMDVDGSINGVLGITWDITEQKLLEEKFLQSQKMESIGTLVGGVAHEFNNTLAGITGSVFLAKSNAKNNHEVLRRLDIISTLSFRAADLIKQLLAFSRKNPVQFKSFDLLDFIKETYELNKLSIPKNIRFVTDFTQKALPVNADPSQIQQILMNLSNNARDAVKGVVKPFIKLTVDLFIADEAFMKVHPGMTTQKFAHLLVEDNGCGISEADINKVFDPFYTTKEVGNGTGLGLAMVYGAVQGHKGVIEVDSNVGKGTCMHIYLPISSLNDNEEQLDSSQLEPGTGECILFVDDEIVLRELGREILESLGYTVLEAMNGVEAIEIFTANKDRISLIIMDVVMPEMGGAEAALAIKDLDENARVIFSTGYEGKDALDASILRWAKVIKKPYGIDSLSQVIKEALQ